MRKFWMGRGNIKTSLQYSNDGQAEVFSASWRPGPEKISGPGLQLAGLLLG